MSTQCIEERFIEMTDDEMRRKMEFTVNQQSQFSADIEQLKELNKQADARLTRVENVLVRLANHAETGFAKLTEAQTRTEVRVGELAEKMVVLAEAQARLTESQAHTDRRLDALIDIIREERNGRSQN